MLSVPGLREFFWLSGMLLFALLLGGESAGQSSSQKDWEKTLAEAKKEGQVTVHGANADTEAPYGCAHISADRARGVEDGTVRLAGTS